MKTRRRPRQTIKPADLFALQLKASNIHFEREYRFHPKRKWKSDFYIPTGLGQQPILVEVEGAVFIGGRHTRGKGYENDCEKYTEACIMGYMLLRGSTGMVRSGYLIDAVNRALGEK